MRPSDESLQIAAQCWCDPETSNIVMDEKLVFAFAKRLDQATAEVARLREALEFYAKPEYWETFISGGGLFGDQEGDMGEAFFNHENNGPDGGATARQALKKKETGGV